jgi:GMP synthase PP-ATPase subunit
LPVNLAYHRLDMGSDRIIIELPGLLRVVYDVCGKPPATID